MTTSRLLTCSRSDR